MNNAVKLDFGQLCCCWVVAAAGYWFGTQQD